MVFAGNLSWSILYAAFGFCCVVGAEPFVEWSSVAAIKHTFISSLFLFPTLSQFRILCRIMFVCVHAMLCFIVVVWLVLDEE